MELCDIILRTNRVRCALNMEILDLLNEKSVSGAHRVELVYKFDEKSYCECLKGESISKVRFKYFFHPQTHIYIYIWTPQPITLPRSRCACGVTKEIKPKNIFDRNEVQYRNDVPTKRKVGM